VQSSLEFVRSGKLRALGLTTMQEIRRLARTCRRSPKSVPGYEASGWLGIGAPKNTPTGVIALLNKALNATVAASDVRARMASLGDAVMPRSSADFGKLMEQDVAKWADVIHSANIKLEQ
jgi:tripartite-type tricarboxylate transporter receptor subunit TctC